MFEPRQQQSYEAVALANQLHLDSSQDSPAYFEDDAEQVRQTNAAMREVFPVPTVGVNVIVWALTSLEARTQLVDWDMVWGPRVVAELRTAFLLARNNGEFDRFAQIQAVIDAC